MLVELLNKLLLSDVILRVGYCGSIFPDDKYLPLFRYVTRYSARPRNQLRLEA